MVNSGARSVDVAVVGAGIVGLAAAREILQRHPGMRLAVLEKEERIGTHQTRHNSGVIHSGVYYTPGSLKARLCQEGSRQLFTYCEQKGIPTERCGKVIVATDSGELPRLRELFDRGRANEVEGLELVGPERLREIEPNCIGIEALWSPVTGITDFEQIAAALAEDVSNLGGEILTRHGVYAIDGLSRSVAIQTNGGDVESAYVLACAGLFADRVAAMTGAELEPAIIPFRGDYWILDPSRKGLVRNLIYPVPDMAFPFLGVHLTRRVRDGAVLLGPNAVLAFAREGYRRLDVGIRDLLQTFGHPGFRRLARRYWRVGLAEMYRDFRKSAFLHDLQRYVPEIDLRDMRPGPSGVRAQAITSDGRLVDDFVFNVHNSRVLHVRNAPSPAATSSLAIARLIADTMDRMISEGDTVH